MKENRKKLPVWIKISLLAAAAVLAAFATEKLYFCSAYTGNSGVPTREISLSGNPDSIQISTEAVLVPLSEDERNSILMDRENAKIMSELNGEKYLQKRDDTLVEDETAMYRKRIKTRFTVQLSNNEYLRKIALHYEGLEVNSAYTLHLYEDEEAVFEGLDGRLDARIDTAVVTVNQKGNRIVYEFYSEEAPEVARMSLTILNDTFMNKLRLYFLSVLYFVIALFCLRKADFWRNPQYPYILFSLLLGSLLILCVGTNQVGFDEHTHAARSYDISFGSEISTTESAMRMKGNDLPFFHNVEERKLIEAYENENNDFLWADITSQSRFISYTDRSYIPISIGIKAGRVLNLPFAWNMMLGKFGNLLLVTFLGFLSIHFAKSGKAVIAMLSLIPNSVFASASFTYDGVVNGFLLLAVVLTTNYLLDDNEKITWIQVLLVLSAYIAGSTAKPIYILMTLPLIFLPRKKFHGKVQGWGFRLSVAAIAGLLLYTVFFPPVASSAGYELMGNLAFAGDKRNQGTSVLGQIKYIVNNPFTYAGLLMKSMLGDLWYYLSGIREFFNYGYLGGIPGIFTVAGSVLLAAVSLIKYEGEDRPVIAVKMKVIYLLMILGMSAVIWTSMYISFTPVGNSSILGVQGRYFFPLLLPFCYCLFNKRVICKLKAEIYYKIALGFVVFLNLYAIYTLALKPINF